jgi:hypothetical protein
MGAGPIGAAVPIPGPAPMLPNVPGEMLSVSARPATQEAARCFWCESLHRAEHALSVCPACKARYTTMQALEMNGSYPLSDQAIDAALTRTLTSAGNYALGYMDGDAFSVFYVGRSDSDLKRRLHEWVDTPSRYDAYASRAICYFLANTCTTTLQTVTWPLCSGVFSSQCSVFSQHCSASLHEPMSRQGCD